MSKQRLPTTLNHYTTQDTLLAMLNDLKENNDKPYLNFHASHLFMMNDKMEGKLLLEKFYTDSKKNSILQNEINKVIEEVGQTFVISFSHYQYNEYRNGIIPMWMMYADSGKGVCLHFNASEIENNCKENSLLKQCQYKHKNKVEKATSQRREKVETGLKVASETKKSQIIKDFLFEIPEYKENVWSYEKEWRLIILEKDIKFKKNRLGLIKYCDYKIPLKALTKIVIGHAANKEVLESSLIDLKKKLVDKYPSECKFKIEKSNLKIQ